MGGVSPEEIARARKMDLLTYLQYYEPQELVPLGHGNYCTRTHDSLKISNGKWMWFSRGFGGRSALDYLIKVKGYSFIDAVNTINSHKVIYSPSNSCPQRSRDKKLLLPKKNMDNSRVISYLSGRGIDSEIITYCLDNGLLYESFPYHNAVFVGFDQNKIPRYAAYRATGKEKILGDAAGSDKKYCFKILNPNSSNLHVFESAIDLLSYATLLKKGGKNWYSESLLSLAGVYSMKKDGSIKVPSAIEKVLSKDTGIDKIYLHLDNDGAGRLSAMGLKKALEDKYEVYDLPPPRGKDFNDYLQYVLNRERKDRENIREYER